MTANEPAGLARRRYRLGLRMASGAAYWLRYWLILAAVLAVAGGPAIHLVWGTTGSVWEPTISVLQWFTAITAGVFLHAMLPPLIAQGLTRREITVAFLVFGAVAAVALAAVATGGHLVEHAVLDLVGDPLNTWTGALATGVRYLLITPVYFFAGGAVVAVAMRVGKGGALVALVFVLFPAVLVSGALGVEFAGRATGADVAAWLGGGLAFLAALVAVVVATLRNLPVPAKGA